MELGRLKVLWEYCKPIWEFLRPIIFPEHHRKVTRNTQWIGITLLLGTPFLQWIVQTVIVSGLTSAFGLPLELLSEHLEGGQVLGFWLVMASLGYSAVILWIQTWDTRSAQTEKNRAAEHVLHGDRALYQDFLADFGLNGALESLVCQHNFGSSWPSRTTTRLLNFIVKWSAPERLFQHPELSSLFVPVLQNMKTLNQNLSQNAGPLQANAAWMGIFDPAIHSEFDTEAYVTAAISEANRVSSAVCDARVAFIRRAGELFATLSPQESQS